MGNVRTVMVYLFEKYLLLVFSIFLVFAPFSNQVVKAVYCNAAFGWLMINIFKHKQKFYRGLIPKTALNKPMLFFLGSCILSILFSLDPYHSQGVFFDRFLVYFLLFWIAAGFAATSRKNLSILIGVFILWNFVFAAGGVRDYFYYRLVNPDLAERIWSTFGKRIIYYGFPLYLTYFIPFNFFVLLLSKNRWLKGAGLANLFLLLPCLFWNSSRIAWVAVVLSIASGIIVKKKKAALLSLAVLILLLSITFLFPKTRDRIKTIPFPSEWSNRMPLYRSAFAIFRDYPALGAGIGMFEKVLHRPKYELPKDYPVPKELNLHAHNTYLEVAAEMGIAGLFTFLWIFAVFFTMAWHWTRGSTGSGSPKNENHAIFLGLAGSIVAMLIFAFGTTIITVGITVSSYFWFLMGLAAGLFAREEPAPKIPVAK